jgi:O-succinylhomoserine sulfhydrylase
MLEGRMASFEGAEACRATATGMAAVTAAMMAPVRAGDHVVAASAFGSCRYIIEDHLPRYGVETTLVEGTDLEAWRKAVRPNTKLFFLESPSNPTLEVLDIAAVAKVAKEAGASSSSTTSSPRRSSSARSSSAPISSSIPRPSISTARAAASAG